MKLEVATDRETLANMAADFIIKAADNGIAERGVFTMAISGGETPRRMLEILAESGDVEWEFVHLFQVDEHIAPAGHPDRNATMLGEAMLTPSFRSEYRMAGLWLMPVEEDDPVAAALEYEKNLCSVTGRPIVIDLIQLGLDDSGQTASLVSGDNVLDVTDRDIAVTGEHSGRRRMTFTSPIISRARQQLWVVAGDSKRDALNKLLSDDPSISATGLCRKNAFVLADADAAGYR